MRLKHAHTGAMDNANFDFQSFSDTLTRLVETSVACVVGLKAGAYRSASGVAVGENLIAVADSTLRREERIPVQAADGTRGSGTLLGREPRLHLAFITVEGLTLKPLPPSDPATWKPGMLAAIVGLTTDAGPSASLGMLGVVSGPRRTWRGGMMDRFVRLDANVYPSQSGAAVVDPQGRLIGMATPGLLQYSTVALPVETLNRVANELLKRGRIRQGYLGVGVQRVAVRQGANQPGDEQTFGLIILSVEPDSPAEKAELQLGDVLLSLDGKQLSDVDDLQDVLAGERVGSSVEVIFSRAGDRMSREITIAEREKKGR